MRAVICDRDCSKHGVCRNKECHCEPGWKGDDCETSKPLNFFTMNELTDCSTNCLTDGPSFHKCDAVLQKFVPIPVLTTEAATVRSTRILTTTPNSPAVCVRKALQV